MTGSALAPVIIPIVAFPLLALWLVMVFYANAHPMHRGRGAVRSQSAARAPERTAASGEQRTAVGAEQGDRGEQAGRAREPAPPDQKAA